VREAEKNQIKLKDKMEREPMNTKTSNENIKTKRED
jgi:hypothetical protein